MRLILVPIVLLTLAACHKADNEPGPGGVTMGEARALEEAAEMIEAQRLTPEAMPRPGVPADAQPARPAEKVAPAKPAG